MIVRTFRLFMKYNVFDNFRLYEEVKRNPRFGSVTLPNSCKKEIGIFDLLNIVYSDGKK